MHHFKQMHLHQAAWQYYKKAVEILKKLISVEANVDTCLYVKKSEKSIMFVALYIDNNLMVGDIEAIDEPILALEENGLVLKIMEGLQDYLSCKIRFSKNKKRAWLGQPHLIENLCKKHHCIKNV